MIISGVTPSQVWGNSARSLTNFGSGALAAASSLNQTLAASSTVDLRTSVGIVGLVTTGVKTGAAATAASNISLNDGTTRYVCAITAAAANSFAGFTMVNTNSSGLAVQNNDGAVAATYATSAFLLTI